MSWRGLAVAISAKGHVLKITTKCHIFNNGAPGKRRCAIRRYSNAASDQETANKSNVLFIR